MCGPRWSYNFGACGDWGKQSVGQYITLRVHVPNNWVLGIWVIVIVVQVLVSIGLLGTWTLRVNEFARAAMGMWVVYYCSGT